MFVADFCRCWKIDVGFEKRSQDCCNDWYVSQSTFSSIEKSRRMRLERQRMDAIDQLLQYFDLVCLQTAVVRENAVVAICNVLFATQTESPSRRAVASKKDANRWNDATNFARIANAIYCHCCCRNSGRQTDSSAKRKSQTWKRFQLKALQTVGKDRGSLLSSSEFVYKSWIGISFVVFFFFFLSQIIIIFMYWFFFG